MEHYTLIGHPLGHSMSPWIHERLFALAGREADYTLTDLVAEDLTLQIDDLRAMQGFNITIPHKMAILPMLDALDESAARYQSVNCVAQKEGKLIGYNTDCDGFTLSVKDFPMNGKVLLVGCGGVGRMMALEALRCGADLTIGILPLVPGGGIYYTMEYCVSGQTSQFIETGIHTFAIAGALAVGVLIVSSLVRLFHMMHIIKRFKNLRAKFAKI